MPTESEALAPLTDGERVSPLLNDSCYQAHLSIYEFARPWCQGGIVLDAGSGTGYGSADLADHGAAFVHGIELDPGAVAFSQEHFQRDNLRFYPMDLAAISGFSDHSFDLIFSSNVLEHVADIPAFMRKAVQLLAEDGRMIIAVPPITTPYLRAANLINPFHVNIWSPRQWDACFQRYFGEVQYYSHWLGRPGQVLDFNLPLPTVVPSAAWSIAPVSLDELAEVPTLTAIFVLQQPLPAAQLPPPGAALTYVDGSFTRTAPEPLATELAALVIEQAQQIERQQAVLREQAQQITVFEQLINTKNAHIQHCEAVIQALENGRVMRVLRGLALRRRT